MQIKPIIADTAVGLIGGSVGTKVMEPVSMKLYELEPEAERQQEDRVRPGPPYAHRCSEDGHPPRAASHRQAGGAGRAGFSLWIGHELEDGLHPAPHFPVMERTHLMDMLSNDCNQRREAVRERYVHSTR